ncbi:histone deacetylase, partial [Vibrio vulnificus]|nr:histone deacetylase [Vibrio vulnificus]
MIPLIYHSIYSQLPLPPGHRYPINKYRLLYDALIEMQADTDWLRTFEFFSPTALNCDAIKQVHDSEYV